MAFFKVKNKESKEVKMDSYKMKQLYEDLDNEAWIQYNSKFSELGKKEQDEISRKELHITIRQQVLSFFNEVF